MSTTSNTAEAGWASQAHAIMVGITDFRDPSYTKKPLPQTAQDALGLKQVFEDRLGWNPGNIIALTGEITKADIRNTFGTLRTKIVEGAPCDLFVLLVSTHGHIYERIQRGKSSTLLATDTQLQDPLLIADTGLTRDILGAYVDSIPARQKVVILDACFASSALSAGDISPTETYKDLDAAVLSSAIGRSFAQVDKPQSLFTGHLIEVLKTLNGEIGLGTVFDSVSRNLPKNIQRPFFDAKARYIALGIVGLNSIRRQLTHTNLIDFTRAQLAVAQGRYSARGWDAKKYVSRKDLEKMFSDYLTDPRSSVFTLTGAAGSGKTTSLLFLAQSAKDQAHPVLWFSRADLSAYPTILALILDSLASVGGKLDMLTLEELMKGHGPIVVFLDAVNEWSSDATTLGVFCSSLKELSSSLFRVVLSCRDEAWPGIATKLATGDDGSSVVSASAHLGDFNEAEFAEARQKLNNVAIPEWPNSRNPLFLRILAGLDSQSDQKESPSTYSLVFSKYLDAKFLRIEERFSLSGAICIESLNKIMEVFNDRRVQTILAVEFLELVGDRMGSALLDEGLVRRVGNGVAIENESLHQYLLSRLLPSDPFAFGQPNDLPLSDPWWGAAAIKLLEMQDSDRVLQVIRQIYEADRHNFYYGSTIYILNFLGRTASIEPYKQFIVKELAANSQFFTDQILKFASTILLREGRSEVRFIFSLAKMLFVHETEDWRAKKWSDWSTYNFQQRLSGLDQSSPAHLLAEVVSAYPQEGFSILVSEWMADPTLLRDGETQILDIAFAFLLNMSVDAPEEFAAAITDAAQLLGRLPSQSQIHLARIFERIGTARFDHLVVHLASWLNEPELRELALIVIAKCPDGNAAEALAVVEQFLDGEHVNQASITSVLTSLGNISSRRILEYDQSKIGITELQPGIVRGSTALFPFFPQEVMRLITPLFNEEFLRSDTVDALDSFCRHYLCKMPTKVTPFLSRIVRDYPGRYDRDIALAIAGCKPNDVLSDLTELLLERETDSVALEHLLIYLRQVRALKSMDVGWIRRWVMSESRPFGLLVALGRSEIPATDIVALIFDMDVRSDGYLEATVNSSWHDGDADALKALAVLVVNSKEVSLLRPESRDWFNLVSNGEEADNALKRVRTARWNSRHKSLDTNSQD